MARMITAKYSGTCAGCGAKLAAGSTVYWAKGQGVECLSCGAGSGGTGLENTDVAIGAARASHIRETAAFFGEGAAAAEELAWELKDPSY